MFDKISTEFRGILRVFLLISQDFADLPEFRAPRTHEISEALKNEQRMPIINEWLLMV